MQRPPPASVHQWYTDEGHDDHDGADPDRRELGVGLAQAGRDEQVGGVVEHLQGPKEYFISKLTL